MNHSETFILVGKQDIEILKKTQQDILRKLEDLNNNGKSTAILQSSYVTANEFMQAVRIRRWKFNCLIRAEKIMSIKKKRKIYVPRGEVKRYLVEVNE
jgi:SAM-dependent MidA family methyltransferase